MFPSSRSREDPFKLEEERRLCYVGVTRAEDKLYLMCCRSRMLYGDRMANLPSRFLEEMELVDPIEKRSQRPYGYRQERVSFGGYGQKTGGDAQRSLYIKPAAPVKPKSPSGMGFGAAAPAQNAGGKTVVGSAYKKMQRVVHDKFGRGVITDVSGTGNTATITVDFEKVGVKRLAAAYVSMKLEE